MSECARARAQGGADGVGPRPPRLQSCEATRGFRQLPFLLSHLNCDDVQSVILLVPHRRSVVTQQAKR